MGTLTVHNAEIRTATVEVKTLTISGRQVTQAVFKQLPDRQLVNDDGRLNGQPWGRVNYHPDKCADDEKHLHVVWQRGKELLRSRVDVVVTYPRWIRVDAASGWLNAKVRDDAANTLTGWRPMSDEFTKTFLGVKVHMVMSHEAAMVTLARQRVESTRRDIAAHGPAHLVCGPSAKADIPAAGSGRSAAMAAARAAARRVRADSALAAFQDELEKALAAMPVISLADAEEKLLAEVRTEADRRRRHQDVRTALADLPQLFIAV
ncbi:hypothetical protein GCM10010109_67770 [Actinoplanes campanulatus]|nr:hypothetical protein GCM10010109_67770 [Actinoplanes campanulatus]